MSSEIHVAVPGSEILRFDKTVRVGRADTNGVVLNDDVVSSEHLELRKGGEGWEILDLGSTNGTFIDGVRVTRASLGARTAVRLGPGGPTVHLTIPGLSARDATRVLGALDIADRYLADETPEGMSPRTGLIRQIFQERREQETHSWVKRTLWRSSNRDIDKGNVRGMTVGLISSSLTCRSPINTSLTSV